LSAKKDEIFKKLKAIGFTDSVGSVSEKESEIVKNFLSENAINWIKSKNALDYDEGFSKNQSCQLLSSGHEKHENTSRSCQSSLFKFLESKLKN
jgi:hypothetical protein